MSSMQFIKSLQCPAALQTNMQMYLLTKGKTRRENVWVKIELKSFLPKLVILIIIKKLKKN